MPHPLTYINRVTTFTFANGIISLFGSIASIWSIYLIKSKSENIIVYIIVLVLFFALVIGLMLKYKYQSSKDLVLFTDKAHRICHTMRDFFIDLFDQWQKQKDGKHTINADEVKKNIAQEAARHLSSVIYKATKVETCVVIKTISATDIQNEIFLRLPSRKDKKEVFNRISNCANLNLETLCVFRNGEIRDSIPAKVNIKDHTLYSHILCDIISNVNCYFLAPNTKKFIKTVLSTVTGAKFYNPDGNFYLKGGTITATNSDSKEWYDVQQGIIAVPISNERHQKNDHENSLIYGIIKLSVRSRSTLRRGSDRDAYIELLKTFGDAMYKCFERIDYYESANQ